MLVCFVLMLTFTLMKGHHVFMHIETMRYQNDTSAYTM